MSGSGTTSSDALHFQEVVALQTELSERTVQLENQTRLIAKLQDENSALRSKVKEAGQARRNSGLLFKSGQALHDVQNKYDSLQAEFQALQDEQTTLKTLIEGNEKERDAQTERYDAIHAQYVEVKALAGTCCVKKKKKEKQTGRRW